MSFSSPALLRTKAESVSMAILEATSPALCPPMPSHTANRLTSVSTTKLSSLSFRRRPTSVCPIASSMPLSPFSPWVPLGYGLPPGPSTNGPRRRAQHLHHLAHRALHAHQHRPGHDVVADVELADLGEGGDGADVPVGQAVAGVDEQSQLAAQPRGVDDEAQGGLPRALVPRLGVGRGVDLDGGDPDLVRLLDLLEVGVHEQAHVDAP